MKLFKKITASVLACTLLMGSVSMLTSAWFTTSNTSSYVSIKTTNPYTNSRLLVANIMLFNRQSGAHALSVPHSLIASQYGNTQSIASRNSNYTYQVYGAIYNGASSASGVTRSYWVNFN